MSDLQQQSESQMADRATGTPQKAREVNLGCKVPEPWRRHWAAEAKRAGVTMTEVIIQALTDRFGKPEDEDIN